MAKLGDICTKITDGSHNPPAGIGKSEYLMLSSKNIEDNNITYIEPRYLRKEDFENENRRTQVAAGDLLLTIVGTVGRVAVVKEGMNNICLQRSVAVLKPNHEIVDSRFLMYQIQGMRKLIEAESRGVAQKGIYLSQVEQLPVTLPDLATQRQIAATLDKVTEGITICKQMLSDLDALVKSRFVEMFGDPNNTGRASDNKHKIGEFCDVTKLAGFEFSEYINYQDSGEIIMLRGLNCKQGKLVLDNVKYIDKETAHKLPRSRLYKGDILMTYAGTIGDVAIVDEDDKYHLAPNVAKISIANKEKVNPIFLVHLFMYSHDYIMTFASQVAQASINMQKIRDFEYIIPSIEEQNEFERFAKEVDKSKSVVQKALDESQLLFDSLMQKYFG